MNILVTGGAGYIGSHMVRMLHAKGHHVVVLDTLEHGHRASLPESVEIVVGSVGDTVAVEKALSTPIDAVIHFAAYISVEESVRDPRAYMENNFIAPVTLLDAMAHHNVRLLIFSSTAAIYGNPQTVPIPENHPKNPANPYGLSKWNFEQLLSVYEKYKAIRSISLRYFNASGASLDGKYGEAHAPETHIIPRALESLLQDDPSYSFTLFGTDYDTRDGSCERDYIHIEDLCSAHLLALSALEKGHVSDVYNVGTGKGVTNKEVLSAIEVVTGKSIRVSQKGRRSGDASILVADTTHITQDLGFRAKHSDIHHIIESAWKWHKTHPHGYDR